ILKTTQDANNENKNFALQSSKTFSMGLEINYRFAKDNFALSMPPISNFHIIINYKYLQLLLIEIFL
ncbi:MAG: hypothetical protein P8X80_11335, partial [Desulfobacterales bacterium]